MNEKQDGSALHIVTQNKQQLFQLLMAGWLGVPFFYLSAVAVDLQSCCFATILRLYAPPKRRSVLVVFILVGGLFISFCFIGRPSQASLATSVVYPEAFISPSSFCCNMLIANDSEVVDCGHEHTLLWPSIFLQVSSDHCCCGQGLPVLKLGIVKQSFNLCIYCFVS